jgi:hypothetical protein
MAMFMLAVVLGVREGSLQFGAAFAEFIRCDPRWLRAKVIQRKPQALSLELTS